MNAAKKTLKIVGNPKNAKKLVAKEVSIPKLRRRLR
jgi:hypothetical protein